MVCEDRRWAWQGSGFLILPLLSEGFWLRRRGAKWVGSVPSQGHDRAGSSPPRSAPSTRVRKVARPPDALQGPMAQSVGCLDARHYVPAGSARQQPG